MKASKGIYYINTVVDLQRLHDGIANKSFDKDITIRAYKYVTKDLDSPWVMIPQWEYRHLVNAPIRYHIGSTQDVPYADTDKFNDCGRGIHVAPFNQCGEYNWPVGRQTYCLAPFRIIVLEFKLSDIATIPLHKARWVTHAHPSSIVRGKFRLHRAKVIGEVSLDGKLLAWLRGKTVCRRKIKWVPFTTRTNYPKLRWLIEVLTVVTIPTKIEGESSHAPILMVPDYCLDNAMEFLSPSIDEKPDDDPMFQNLRDCT